MEDFGTTLRHCLTSQVCSLDKAEYEIVRNSILKNLLAYGTMTPETLGSLVNKHLKYKYHGSLSRYYELVRMDLLARGEIRFVPNASPPLIEIPG